MVNSAGRETWALGKEVRGILAILGLGCWRFPASWRSHLQRHRVEAQGPISVANLSQRARAEAPDRALGHSDRYG